MGKVFKVTSKSKFYDEIICIFMALKENCNYVQDDPSGLIKSFVDNKTKVPSHHRLLFLKRNFQFDTTDKSYML